SSAGAGIDTALPPLGEGPRFGAAEGKPVRRVETVTEGGRWASTPAVRSVRIGEPLTGEVARRAMRELLATGRFARANADAAVEADGAVLRLTLLPRRLIATIRISGAALETGPTLEAAQVSEGGEVTASLLPIFAERIKAHYAAHGYTACEVRVD